jgi:hypothetical protein
MQTYIDMNRPTATAQFVLCCCLSHYVPVQMCTVIVLLSQAAVGAVGAQDGPGDRAVEESIMICTAHQISVVNFSDSQPFVLLCYNVIQGVQLKSGPLTKP